MSVVASDNLFEPRALRNGLVNGHCKRTHPEPLKPNHYAVPTKVPRNLRSSSRSSSNDSQLKSHNSSQSSTSSINTNHQSHTRSLLSTTGRSQHSFPLQSNGITVNNNPSSHPPNVKTSLDNNNQPPSDTVSTVSSSCSSYVTPSRPTNSKSRRRTYNKRTNTSSSTTTVNGPTELALAESGHDEFIRAFAVPIHLYRFLAQRWIDRPLFLSRTLSYLRPTPFRRRSHQLSTTDVEGFKSKDSDNNRIKSISQLTDRLQDRRIRRPSCLVNSIGSDSLSPLTSNWPSEIELTFDGFHDSPKEVDWLTVEASVQLQVRIAWAWHRKPSQADSLITFSPSNRLNCAKYSSILSTTTESKDANLSPSIARFNPRQLVQSTMLRGNFRRLDSAQLELRCLALERKWLKRPQPNGPGPALPNEPSTRTSSKSARKSCGLGSSSYPVHYATAPLPLFYRASHAELSRETASGSGDVYPFLLTPGLYELRLGVDDMTDRPVASATNSNSPTADNHESQPTLVKLDVESGSTVSHTGATSGRLEWRPGPVTTAHDSYVRWPTLRFQVNWHHTATNAASNGDNCPLTSGHPSSTTSSQASESVTRVSLRSSSKANETGAMDGGQNNSQCQLTNGHSPANSQASESGTRASLRSSSKANETAVRNGSEESSPLANGHSPANKQTSESFTRASLRSSSKVTEAAVRNGDQNSSPPGQLMNGHSPANSQASASGTRASLRSSSSASKSNETIAPPNRMLRRALLSNGVSDSTTASSKHNESESGQAKTSQSLITNLNGFRRLPSTSSILSINSNGNTCSISGSKSRLASNRTSIRAHLGSMKLPMHPVTYRMLFKGRLQQWSESSNLVCPYCQLDCWRARERGPEALLVHLRTCHPRFRFKAQWSPSRSHISLEVTLNDTYDGSNDCSLRRWRCSALDNRRHPYPDNRQLLGAWSGLELIKSPVGNKRGKDSQQHQMTFSLTSCFANRYLGPVRRFPFTHLIWRRPDGDRYWDQPLESVLGANDVETEGHNRVYYHTQSIQPICAHEADQDSESEDAPEWLRQHYQRKVEEFTDVNQGEKQLMQLWNAFLISIRPSQLVVCDSKTLLLTNNFLHQYAPDIARRSLRANLTLHLANMSDYGLLTAKEVNQLMRTYDLLARSPTISSADQTEIVDEQDETTTVTPSSPKPTTDTTNQ